ncbi:MAG: DUF2225 domain-containing protein [Syntrophomonadaceae bacterium]|nr:DUF2225 domain-containing protein [Syntrophomonadaceae bacterium]
MPARGDATPTGKIEQDYLYDKTVVCPVCNSKITVKVVKASRLRIIHRDTDSMAVYKDINPLLYDVWLCNHCGYANLQTLFHKPLSKSQIQLIKTNITARWKPRDYPQSVYSEAIALERFKLAIYNATVRHAASSEIAMLCLKTAWIYRMMKDETNEVKYLTWACQEFEKAYETEDTPAFGMDATTQMYLMGELCRRTGNYARALRWLGEVITSPSAKQTLKDKARDQKDLVLEMMKKETT